MRIVEDLGQIEQTITELTHEETQIRHADDGFFVVTDGE